MSIDLSALDTAGLLAAKAEAQETLERVERELVRRRRASGAELRREMAAKAAALGLTLDEVMGGAVSVAPADTEEVKRPRKTMAPKYRDPVSGQTWAGKGFVPAWAAAVITRPDGTRMTGVDREVALKTLEIRAAAALTV